MARPLAHLYRLSNRSGRSEGLLCGESTAPPRAVKPPEDKGSNGPHHEGSAGAACGCLVAGLLVRYGLVKGGRGSLPWFLAFRVPRRDDC